ncbi:hypothetical protein MRX96_039026 [Rhipicephalus microplus]
MLITYTRPISRTEERVELGSKMRAASRTEAPIGELLMKGVAGAVTAVADFGCEPVLAAAARPSTVIQEVSAYGAWAHAWLAAVVYTASVVFAVQCEGSFRPPGEVVISLRSPEDATPETLLTTAPVTNGALDPVVLRREEKEAAGSLTGDPKTTTLATANSSWSSTAERSHRWTPSSPRRPQTATGDSRPAVTVASLPEAFRQRQERDDPAAAAAKAEGPALSYRHAFMDLSVPKRAATPPGSSATPQRPLPVPAMVHHVPGSPPAFSASDTAPAAIPDETWLVIDLVSPNLDTDESRIRITG